MATEKIVERIRKLLELTHSTNENEAALAATRAADLMSEHAVTEAMLQVTSVDDAAGAAQVAAENIVRDATLPDDIATERRVAWRDRIATAVAMSLGCHVYYWEGKLNAVGRESSTQTWSYTCRYLFTTVDELADMAWLENGRDLPAVGQMPRQWKGAFRIGAADVIANRLYTQVSERAAKEKAQAQQLAAAESQKMLETTGEPCSTGVGARQLALVRVDAALAVIAKDRAEVKTAFEKRTSGPGWRKMRTAGNGARRRSGYDAGREAGASVNLGGARNALKA